MEKVVNMNDERSIKVVTDNSLSPKKEIVERFVNIPVKNKTIRKICFFTNNSKKEQNEIRPIKLFIKCAKLK